jgi:hypothetical protein
MSRKNSLHGHGVGVGVDVGNTVQGVIEPTYAVFSPLVE